VATVIREVSEEIPRQINWILRVDGHTDVTPLADNSQFEDNWELSQARALSVVRYFVKNEEIESNRLAATGFGQFQPIDKGFSQLALARNRRIELKLTER
jgi:chemotaxis protein MotB